MEWYPTYDPPSFGIFPDGQFPDCDTDRHPHSVPLGVMSAIYISEIAQRIKEILKSVIELLAGLPSVVLGFFGMVIVAPGCRKLLICPRDSTSSTPPSSWRLWRFHDFQYF